MAPLDNYSATFFILHGDSAARGISLKQITFVISTGDKQTHLAGDYAVSYIALGGEKKVHMVTRGVFHSFRMN